MTKNLQIPDFSPKEILSYFSTLHIPLSINEISKPTSNIQQTYESLLFALKSFRISDYITSEESADAQYLFLLYNQLSTLLSELNFTLTLKDLTQPTSNRTISILSTLINFSMFRDSKRKVFEEVLKVCNEKEDMKDEIQEKINSANNNLKELLKNKEKEKLEIKMLEEEILRIEDKVKEEHKEFRNVKSELEIVKKEHEKISDLLSSNQLLILNKKQEIEILKTQIVSDPEKLLELLSEMRSVVSREKECLVAYEKRRSVNEKEEESLNYLENEVKERIKKEMQFNVVKEKKENFMKEKKMIEDEILSNEKNLKNLGSKNEFLIKQYNHVESKIKMWIDEHKNCGNEIENKIEGMKCNRQRINGLCNETSRRIEENNVKTKEIEFECGKLIAEYEKENDSLKEKLFLFKEKVELYFSEVKKAYQNYI
ncbi:hypothetical protein GVAV_002056 [Gurleya vavrai]